MNSRPAGLSSPYWYALLSALAVSGAWLLPGTAACAALGWIAAFTLVLGLHAGPPHYRPAYVSALLLNILGFYWLCGTIAIFGGFGALPALAVFLLYAALSAVQYLLFVFVFRRLPPVLDRWCLRPALAFTAAEVLSIRIFPWQFGHTQLAFRALAQSAALAGTLTLSFIMFWTCEALARMLTGAAVRRGVWTPLAVLAALVIYGTGVLRLPPPQDRPPVRAALIQANISVQEKHDMRLIVTNVERYRELTRQVLPSADLVVWPESVILDWINNRVASVRNDPRLPYFGPETGLLIGALTYDSPRRRFNSAVAIYPDGTVPAPYHKQVLMPFGEYTPLGDALPWLREMNVNADDLTAGKEVRIYRFPLRRETGGSGFFKVAPNICYEDIIPAPARDAARAGAEILVNLTNDAWFGRSAAPFQHHMIASFRAIENRRYLLRATNTGFTAVVDPSGHTLAGLEIFADGAIVRAIPPLNETTPYTAWVGESPWRLLAYLSLLIAVIRFRRAAPAHA